MDSIIDRKKNRILSRLVESDYNNPFILHHNVIHQGRDLGIDVINHSYTFKGCAPLGFYNNLMCEIMNYNTILTKAHHEHMLRIRKQWGFIPYLLYVVNDEIQNIIQYNIKTFPDQNWVSASKTRNYMLDDPLIDFLKYKNMHSIQSNDEIQVRPGRKRAYSETFTEQLMNNGQNFETTVIDEIQNIVAPDKFVKIGESYEASNISKFIETMNAIDNKIDVIYQPVLWNTTNKTFGCADLIIRSSITNTIFPSYEYDGIDKYEVFDIKWSTINLIKNTNTINNDKGAKIFKAQLWIYTQALNHMTKSKGQKAYVIARKYKKSKTNDEGINVSETLSNPFNELGEIDFTNEKVNIVKFKESIKWLKEVRTNDKLCCDPPNDIRLYPNMKNNDNDFGKIKHDLATKNKELTLLFNVSVKHRENAIKNNIRSMDDPNLSTEMLGLKESPTTSIISNIIEVNSKKCKEDIIYSDMSNCGRWKNAKVRCYVDIEAISTTMYDVAHCRPNFIFMIGIGVVVNNEWDFHIFTAKSLDTNSEQEIITEFNLFMNNLSSKHPKTNHIPLFHWANYEKTNLKPLLNIHDKFKFHDICAWVKDNQICVKGAYNFKLKNYAKALDNLGCIDIVWPSSVSDGINAMNTAYNYYTHDVGERVIEDVKEYNEVDCLSMFKIHQLFREIDAN